MGDRNLKILLLNTSEQTGGAAVAANRLRKALLKSGIEARMLVRDKQSDDEGIYSVNQSAASRWINKMRFAWERLIIFLCNGFKRSELFKVSIANTGTDISNHPLVRDADIIHLHWINQGFLSLNDIQKLAATGKPIVWTLHDMWPCTGICHHAWGCDNFHSNCGKCPFLGRKRQDDLSFRTLQKKKFISSLALGIHFVSVSNWLQGMAMQSVITKGCDTSVIPNVIDTKLFSPSDKTIARKELSLSVDKQIILMGAAKLNDPIKGFQYLREALSFLNKPDNNLLLLLFGEIKNDPDFLASLPVDHLHLGLLSDAGTIARLYAAADLTVVPSLYETFGQTLIEGMACGCPAVSFDNSGQTDIIDHQQNGYLARYKDSEDLARGIEWVLENSAALDLPSACVRKVREHYSESVVANQYIQLYKQLLNRQQ